MTSTCCLATQNYYFWPPTSNVGCWEKQRNALTIANAMLLCRGAGGLHLAAKKSSANGRCASPIGRRAWQINALAAHRGRGSAHRGQLAAHLIWQQPDTIFSVCGLAFFSHTHFQYQCTIVPSIKYQVPSIKYQVPSTKQADTIFSVWSGMPALLWSHPLPTPMHHCTKYKLNTIQVWEIHKHNVIQYSVCVVYSWFLSDKNCLTGILFTIEHNTKYTNKMWLKLF